jgi:hypothetical protein
MMSGMGVFFDVTGLNIVHVRGLFAANCSTFDLASSRLSATIEAKRKGTRHQANQL